MSRRLGRELAIKVLYESEIGGGDLEASLDYHADEEDAPAESRSFAAELIKGITACLDELDKYIATYSRDWRVERLAAVDRNILRLSLYELLHRPDIPASVSINEAVELAKLYGDDESSRFINGILGRVARELSPAGAGQGGPRDKREND